MSVNSLMMPYGFPNMYDSYTSQVFLNDTTGLNLFTPPFNSFMYPNYGMSMTDSIFNMPLTGCMPFAGCMPYAGAIPFTGTTPTTMPYMGGGYGDMSKYYEQMIDNQVNYQQKTRAAEIKLNAAQSNMRQKALVLNEKILQNEQDQVMSAFNDYVSAVITQVYPEINKKGFIERKKYLDKMKEMQTKSRAEVAKQLRMGEENVPLLRISSQLIKSSLECLGAENLWVPGVTLCDGIAYDYAESNKWIKPAHNFEEDIIACAKNISKRYQGSKRRGETLEQICLTIFDSMKKVHGLGKRERLLLQIATLLHDCGKYLNMVSVGECSYHVVMNTEIIGLSHLEREIVANIVKFNHEDFAYYDEITKSGSIDKDSYLIVAKLTAILRVANGLDKTHKQKFKNVKTTIHDNELWIQVDTAENIALEKGLFWNAARFFEEVYNIKPVIKQKRSI